ncbi:MAG: DEAD/DEAH box helicase [Proteobacteria bacterium]|nr:DEAD/DEAH box helicase [Pseudomonadota bacterium]
MSNVTFADLGLAEPLLRALSAANYVAPTPIQARTIPLLLQGRDVLGIAQTGTGKTAAFALPVLQLLSASGGRAQPKSPRALVLAPTRELAVQIAKNFDTYGRGLGLRLGMVIGGLGFGRQIETLQRGVDILIATPGRLLDLMERGNVKLGNVSFLVLDEADRMFDMGFIKDVRRIVASVGRQRQTLLFSATMPPDVAKLAGEILQDPERVEIAPQGRTVERIDQRVYFVNAATKRALLTHLLADSTLERVIVFTRTKRGANRVAEALDSRGVPSEAIHGNKSQNARQRALDNFARGRARVLVATDLAARGIDVSGVTHVINYELPADAESYVHRIGRTARAGASGIAVSFCDGSERGQLKGIERLTNHRLTVVPMPANEDMPQEPAQEPREARSEHRDGPRDGRRPGPRRDHGRRPERQGEYRPERRPEQHAEQHAERRDERPRHEPRHEHRHEPRHEARHEARHEPRHGRPAHQNGQPHGERAGRGEHPRREGDRNHGHRRFGDRHHADRHPSDRQPGDRHQGHRPHGERSWAERDYRDQPRHDERPQAYGERAAGDRPHGQEARPQWRGRRFGGGRRSRSA